MDFGENRGKGSQRRESKRNKKKKANKKRKNNKTTQTGGGVGVSGTPATSFPVRGKKSRGCLNSIGTPLNTPPHPQLDPGWRRSCNTVTGGGVHHQFAVARKEVIAEKARSF